MVDIIQYCMVVLMTDSSTRHASLTTDLADIVAVKQDVARLEVAVQSGSNLVWCGNNNPVAVAMRDRCCHGIVRFLCVVPTSKRLS
jgi:hypothetical protein